MIKLLGKTKDPVSGLTHLFGVFASIVALILLELHSLTVWHAVSFAIYGASLVLLYSASSTYHLLSLGEKGDSILQKIDHMMIFVLIAGTYTPICLISLRGVWGWTLLGIVWGVAVAGITMKALWMSAPRWLSTLVYVLMGWIVVIAIYPLSKAVPVAAIIWLVSGGILYTVGAVIYGTRWPKLTNPWFGSHEIFHLFVLAGSFAHFIVMYLYI